MKEILNNEGKGRGKVDKRTWERWIVEFLGAEGKCRSKVGKIRKYGEVK